MGLIGTLTLAIAACSASGSGTTTASTLASSTATTTTIAPTSTTTVPPTTTTTLSAEELAEVLHDEDVAAIKSLWRGLSDAWSTGTETAIGYMAQHDYPGEECTVDDFAAIAAGLTEGYREEHIVDADTIERDDGWLIPSGPAAAMVPAGRIYIFTLKTVTFTPGKDAATEEVEAHTTVLDDGTSYFFITCGK